jgi:hypothetical protein
MDEQNPSTPPPAMPAGTNMAVPGSPLVIPDVHLRRLTPTELEELASRNRLITGWKAIVVHMINTRQLARCAVDNYPILNVGPAPMTTPAMIDGWLERVEAHRRRP